MKSGVPGLNVFVALIYAGLTATLLYLFKLANKPLPSRRQQNNLPTSSPQINHWRVLLKSWLKKYTLVGSCFLSDRKYLAKEFLMLGTYAVSCLKINQIVLWPTALSAFLVPVTCLIYDVLFKLYHQKKISQTKTKNRTANHEVVEIEIQSVNIESIQTNSVEQLRKEAKNENAVEDRTLVETVGVAAIVLSSIVMLMQTVLTLGNSVSNSGELNISSFLIIVVIDQIAVRFAAGALTMGTIKILEATGKINLQENTFIELICREQIASIWEAHLKDHPPKELENTSCHLKGKQQETDKATEQVCHTPDNQNHLDLLNLQPMNTVIRELDEENDNEEEQEREAQRKRIAEEERLTRKRLEKERKMLLEQIFLTTAEKELFDGADLTENASNYSGKTYAKQNDSNLQQASGNRENMKAEDEKNRFNDLVILKNDTIDDTENIHTTDFNFDGSPGGHNRKKGPPRTKKNKRVLKLSGNSPYLEYLPDMLKKVDKFRHVQKDKKML